MRVSAYVSACVYVDVCVYVRVRVLYVMKMIDLRPPVSLSDCKLSLLHIIGIIGNDGNYLHPLAPAWSRA